VSTLEAVYAHLPVWAQHQAVSAYGLYRYWLRFGGGYRRYVLEYLDRERVTRRVGESRIVL